MPALGPFGFTHSPYAPRKNPTIPSTPPSFVSRSQARSRHTSKRARRMCLRQISSCLASPSPAFADRSAASSANTVCSSRWEVYSSPRIQRQREADELVRSLVVTKTTRRMSPRTTDSTNSSAIRGITSATPTTTSPNVRVVAASFRVPVAKSLHGNRRAFEAQDLLLLSPVISTSGIPHTSSTLRADRPTDTLQLLTPGLTMSARTTVLGYESLRETRAVRPGASAA